MRHTTYSFLDLAGAIAHPAFLPFQLTGEGSGDISITMANEKTVHDLANDGSVMVSKIAGKNGTVSIACQQTSPVHKYLLKLYNFLEEAPVSAWAGIAIAFRNVNDGSSHALIGVSFAKKADKAYAQHGGKVSWSLMAAEINCEIF